MLRRRFLLNLCGLCTAALAGALMACGRDEEVLPGDGDCGTGAGVLQTDTGHQHPTAALSTAQLSAAVPGSYMLLDDGGTGHTHSVHLSTEDFDELKAGRSVHKTTADADAHTIVIRC